MGLIIRIWKALLWPVFEWRREAQMHQQAMLDAALRTHTDALTRLIDAQTAQTKVLQSWMDSFKVTELPSTQTVRDEDEYRAERDRLWDEAQATGDFSHITPEDRVRRMFQAQTVDLGKLMDLSDPEWLTN